MSNFWGRFFQLFVVKKKKKKIWKHCSVRTEKLHRKKVKKKYFFFWEEFFFLEKPFFLGLKIRRGPNAILSLLLSDVRASGEIFALIGYPLQSH